MPADMDAKSIDFDTILESVGSYGRYQRKLMFYIVGCTSFIIGIQISARVFQTIVPDHWCHVDGLENSSMTPEQWKNFTVPPSEDGKGFDKCEHYVITWSEGAPSRSNETVSCTSWEYDRSLLQETLATTNDWVCSKEMYSVHILSVSVAGSCIGTFILPYLADKYTGRRLMYFVSICIHFVFELACIFTSNFPLQLAWRFLCGFTFQTNYQMSYIISVELMAPSKRALAETISFATWAVGMCLTALEAWALRDWRYISGVSLILDLYMFAVFWVLPESPRWLLSKKRTREAAEIMYKVSEVNNVPGVNQDELEKQLLSIEEPDPEPLTPANLKKYPKFCRTAVLMFIISGASYIVYGIISLDVNFVPNSYYMNFFLLSVMEFPSHVTGWLGVQYLGRRMTAIVTNVLCACVSVTAVFVVHEKTALLVVVSLLKWLVTTALLDLYLQVTELYPTTMRSIGMGTIAVFGTALFSAAPYIIKADEGTGGKYWIMAGLCLACAVFSIPVPETLSMPLPQTLAEADTIVAKRPLNKLIHHWNVKKFTPVPFYGGTKTQRTDDTATEDTRCLQDSS